MLAKLAKTSGDIMAKFEFEEAYYNILEEELVPALGCTEPIAIAFASAKAREVLGEFPNKINIRASGSLIKNIRCVSVPNTNHLIGIEASAIAGLVGGDSSLNLEVLSTLNSTHYPFINELLEKKICHVEVLSTPLTLHFILRFETEFASCEIEVKNLHTNVTRIVKNNQVIFEREDDSSKYYGVLTDRSTLKFDRIIEFVETTDPIRLKRLLNPQVEFNMKIAEEGILNPYGLSVGQAILKYDSSLYGKIKAYASAASEARMCGSDLPVITNSGSGNQGIAASIPIIIYAKEKNISEEKMLRALALSNLLTIYQKSFIGRLSAFCGATSASSSSGAALTYLAGGNPDQIKNTVINTLADVSGMVCDGAKASCASKVATSLEAAIIGHFLAMEDKTFKPFSGFIGKDVDDTISSVGKIAKEGMKDTDRILLEIMLEE